MTAPCSALRICLIGIVALLTLLMPQGNCCCAVHRIVSVITGGNAVRACCRLVLTDGDRDEVPVGSFAVSRTPLRECHCGAAKAAAQKPVPSDAEQEAANREFGSKWFDVCVFQATPFSVDRFRDFSLCSLRPPALSLAGREFRIALHSWLC